LSLSRKSQPAQRRQK